MIGTKVGDYKLAKKLGEGGMGMVFLGENEKTGQKAAIKALQTALVANEKARERFVREAEVLSRLSHESIVRMLSYHDQPEGFFIVMELAEGETMETRLQKLGRIGAGTAVPCFIQLLGGLANAHEQGIIHRDLKPANVMITRSGAAKLLDFGTAKLVVGDPKKLTAQGMTLGTLVYMSREQILGKPIDARSDLYSLGVTMFEVVTGRLPFTDTDERKLLHKITKADPPMASEIFSGIPPELDEVLDKALSKEPAARYQTAAEFIDALKSLKLPAAAAAPLPAPKAPQPVTQERKPLPETTERLGTKERTSKIDGPPPIPIPVPAALLVVLHGADKGRRLPLKPNVAVVIGRAAGDGPTGLTLADNGVSSQHCSVTYDGSRFALKDLGSTNGIWLGKERVREGVLDPGGQFAIGSTLLRVLVE